MKNDMNRFHMTSTDRSYIARNIRAIQKENAFYNDLNNPSGSSKSRPNEPLIVSLGKILVYMAIRLLMIAGYAMLCIFSFKYIFPFLFHFVFDLMLGFY